ncbi:12620_t:CDS:2, partial [Racocetra persica]
MPESVAVAVMITYSSCIKGKIFEIDVVELLKSMGLNAGFNVNLHLIQKIILIESNIGPSVVRELRGAVCQRDLGTIGIVVSPRLNFTEFAVNEAKISNYPVILTDKSHLPEIILNLAIDSLQDRP